MTGYHERLGYFYGINYYGVLIFITLRDVQPSL
jgi:hypothetical protein